MSISRKIVEFVLSTSYESIPDEVLEYSRFAFVDYMAVAYAGIRTEDNRIIQSYARLSDNIGKSKVFGSGDRFSSKYASLINGTTAHALDFDDVGITALNHPTVAVAPVVFAIGEQLEKSGKEVLRAFTLSVEVLQKVASMLMPELTNRGWHTTSVFGTIGSTVAASILYGLNEKEFINALGISCSLASGLRVNFGTYTKPFHAGLSAQNGVVAVELARSGVTSSEFAFEGSDGFALAFTGLTISESDLILGEKWDAITSGFQFKKYPVCSSSHTAIDAFLILREEEKIDCDDIEKVIAGMSEFAFRNLLFDNPQTIQEAKFSMPYAIAIAALNGDVTLNDFVPGALEDERVQGMMKKVSMKLDDAFVGKGILGNEPAVVYIQLRSGRELIQRVDHAMGTNHNPLSKDRMRNKFFLCLGDQNDSVKQKSFDGIFNIDSYDNIVDLIGLIPMVTRRSSGK